MSAVEKKEVRHHQEKIGTVTSAKMKKTIVVEVRRRVPHPVYKRIITKRSKFMAHDEHGRLMRATWCALWKAGPLAKTNAGA